MLVDEKKMSFQEKLRRKNEFDGNLVKLGVSGFNEKTGRKNHLKNRSSALSEMLSSETGLLKKSLSVARCCPVCSSSEDETVFCKSGFTHVKCKECEMIYVNPVLKEERLHSYYYDESSWNSVLMNEYQKNIDKKKFQYGLDLLSEYSLEEKRLLDVGSGPGVFLEVAVENGWNVHGIEFNQYCVERIKSLGISVSSDPLEHAELDQSAYTVVTMWDVLEHIVNPELFLKHTYLYLRKNGLILIAVPNVNGLVSRILHEKSATFAGDSHVNFFSETTLIKLLKKCGYSIVNSETMLTEIGTINNHLNYQDPYAGSGGQVMSFLTPEYIHKNMLGSRLLIIARKD